MEKFDFAAPRTVGETLDILAAHGGDARLLAGGQSLMILLRQRLVAADVLVGLKGVGELDTIEREDGSLLVGSMATYRRVAADAAVAASAPVLAEAAGSVGSVHIRNLGTVGGSVCHADPAGDVPTVLLALDATLRTATPRGAGSHAMAGVFTGLFETRLEPDELLVGVEIPSQPAGASFGYRRFSFRAGEYPMGVAACRLEWDGSVCTGARIAVGGGDLHPVRLTELEERLVGERPDDGLLVSAAADAGRALRPTADVRGSAEWKTRVLTRLTARALSDARRRKEQS